MSWLLGAPLLPGLARPEGLFKKRHFPEGMIVPKGLEPDYAGPAFSLEVS
jgi:hypothetical protein